MLVGPVARRKKIWTLITSYLRVGISDSFFPLPIHLYAQPDARTIEGHQLRCPSNHPPTHPTPHPPTHPPTRQPARQPSCPLAHHKVLVYGPMCRKTWEAHHNSSINLRCLQVAGAVERARKFLHNVHEDFVPPALVRAGGVQHRLHHTASTPGGGKQR